MNTLFITANGQLIEFIAYAYFMVEGVWQYSADYEPLFCVK